MRASERIAQNLCDLNEMHIILENYMVRLNLFDLDRLR